MYNFEKLNEFFTDTISVNEMKDEIVEALGVVIANRKNYDDLGACGDISSTLLLCYDMLKKIDVA